MTDAICCVLAKERSKHVVDAVLTEFIPDYKRLSGDYTFPLNNPEYVFSSEEEMIDYFVNHPQAETVFFWNQYDDNPDKVMIGAFLPPMGN
jgi:hypothetical protein